MDDILSDLARSLPEPGQDPLIDAIRQTGKYTYLGLVEVNLPRLTDLSVLENLAGAKVLGMDYMVEHFSGIPPPSGTGPVDVVNYGRIIHAQEDVNRNLLSWYSLLTRFDQNEGHHYRVFVSTGKLVDLAWNDGVLTGMEPNE